MEVVAKSGKWYIVKPGSNNADPGWKLELVHVETTGGRGLYYTNNAYSVEGPRTYPPKALLLQFVELAAAAGESMDRSHRAAWISAAMQHRGVSPAFA